MEAKATWRRRHPVVLEVASWPVSSGTMPGTGAAGGVCAGVRCGDG